jgi:hypothetical protein
MEQGPLLLVPPLRAQLEQVGRLLVQLQPEQQLRAQQLSPLPVQQLRAQQAQEFPLVRLVLAPRFFLLLLQVLVRAMIFLLISCLFLLVFVKANNLGKTGISKETETEVGYSLGHAQILVRGGK